MEKCQMPRFIGGTYVIKKPKCELFNILVCSAISEIVPYSANKNPNFYGLVCLIKQKKYMEALDYIGSHIDKTLPEWRKYTVVWDCSPDELPDPRDLRELKDLLCYLATLDYFNKLGE